MHVPSFIVIPPPARSKRGRMLRVLFDERQGVFFGVSSLTDGRDVMETWVIE